MTKYTYIGIMFKLTVEYDAQHDLTLMIQKGGKDREFAVKIAALLSELKADQKLLGALLDHKFENNKFHVSRFQSIWRERDVWRLKVFEWDCSKAKTSAIPYRIIYAYDLKYFTFRVLAVAPRSFNYENDHPIVQRLLKTYSELGLPISKSHQYGKSRH